MPNIRLTFDATVQCCGICGQQAAKVGDQLKLSIDLVKFPGATTPIRGTITAVTAAQSGDPYGTVVGYQLDVDAGDMPGGAEDLGNCDLTGVECVTCCDLNEDRIVLLEAEDVAQDARLDTLEALEHLFEREVASLALVVANGDWFRDEHAYHVMENGEIRSIPYTLDTPLNYAEIADLGEGGHISWTMGPLAAARGTDIYAGGVKFSDRYSVVMHWDGATLDRKEDLWQSLNVPGDDHTAMVILPDGRNAKLLAAQSDHSEPTSDNIRFYLSPDGDVDNLALDATLLSDAPTYANLFRDGDRVFLWARKFSRADAEWLLWYTPDYTTAPAVFAETACFVGNYLTFALAIDGSGVWVHGGPSPTAPSVTPGGDVQTQRVWCQNIVAPAFIDFAADSLEIGGNTEIGNIKTMGATDDINLQSRNLFGLTDKFEGPPWVNSNTDAVINGAATDRWGRVANGVVRLNSIGGLSSHYVSQLLDCTAGQQYTLSVFCAAAEQDKIKLFGHLASFGAGVHPYATYDLATGTVNSKDNVEFAGIEPWGNGWYRIWITYTPTASVLGAEVRIDNQDATYSNNYNADGDGVFLQGAQLQRGGLTEYQCENKGTRVPDNPSPILYTAPKNYSLRVMKMRPIVAGYVEFAWAQYEGYIGITDSNEENCRYFYGRYNTATQEMENITDLGPIGRGTGEQDNYAGGIEILGVCDVVFAQNNLYARGRHYLKRWKSGKTHVLKESAGDYMLRPNAILIYDAQGGVSIDPEKFTLLEGLYDAYTDWSLNTKLVESKP